MTKDIQKYKVDKVTPYLKTLEEKKSKSQQETSKLSREIQALKYYLNGMSHNTDVTHITDPIESEIQNMLKNFSGNTTGSAPLKG